MTPVDLRPRPPRQVHSPLWHVNAALARPVAAVFGLLGVAPGQLSLQSVTLTILGLVRAAAGDWAHMAQGAAIVYAGLLLDRADDLLAARAGPVGAWSRFLGLMADRLVEAGLVLALGWLSLRTTAGWRPFSESTALVLVAALASTLLLARLAAVYGDLLVLRVHLAHTRRLPGPSAIADDRALHPWLSRLVDRDVFVAIAVGAIAARQLQAGVVILLAGQAVVLVEQFVLFWSRRRDPEAHAALVLARGP